jgi:hypothetical protein
VLTALGERDAPLPPGAALQAMITDESLTVSEAVQWCAGVISHREAARLRQLAGSTNNKERGITRVMPLLFDSRRWKAALDKRSQLVARCFAAVRDSRNGHKLHRVRSPHHGREMS